MYQLSGAFQTVNLAKINPFQEAWNSSEKKKNLVSVLSWFPNLNLNSNCNNAKKQNGPQFVVNFKFLFWYSFLINFINLEIHLFRCFLLFHYFIYCSKLPPFISSSNSSLSAHLRVCSFFNSFLIFVEKTKFLHYLRFCFLRLRVNGIN